MRTQSHPFFETSFVVKPASRYLVFLSLAATFLLQAGCSSLQTVEPEYTTINAPEGWEATAQKIEALRNWTLIGKVGIRTPEDSLTVAINQWQQTNTAFKIDLSSTFFGLGASKLIGTPSFITIIESGEPPVSSFEPDLLINEALGFPLPISSLSWWLKGIPIPESPHHLEFNELGFPASLTQNQWQLSFSKHKMVDGLPLPGKVKLERDNVRIILAIKQWTPL